MSSQFETQLLPGELWWGGKVVDGTNMPFGASDIQQDLSNVGGNQAMPLLISNLGRSIWCEDAFSWSIAGRTLRAEPCYGLTSKIELTQEGNDLRGALLGAASRHFPPQGKYPDPLLFRAPQYNTWIEMIYEPTQEKVATYTETLLEAGFPPGVLMIDDNWMESNGTWRFHPGRFPKPSEMVDRLHRLGFKLMLWTCPFVSPDTQNFRELEGRGCLIRDASGKTQIRKWWNGFSAILDLTNPQAVEWYQGELNKLRDELGVDGFKFDAGDGHHFNPDDLSFVQTTPGGHTEAFSRIGLKWPLNEFRAAWKTAGWPLAQRIRDREHEWDERGLATLVPDGLAQGLLGYAFTCPDLIAGGSWLKFTLPDFVVDEELFVRYAQCSALFPMMQFSLSPWRVLSKRSMDICRRMAHLHVEMAGVIERLAQHAAKTGEPILRHLEYVFPHSGFERVNDQFMLGDEILVAPVLQRGAATRDVLFPEGRWIGDDGKRINGPCRLHVPSPLERLPWYRKENV